MPVEVKCPTLHVPLESLEQSTFSSFGTVIQCPPTDASEEYMLNNSRCTTANQGSAFKWANVTNLTNFYDESAPSRVKARPSVSLFHCMPRDVKTIKTEAASLRSSAHRSSKDEGRPDAESTLSAAPRVFEVPILERHPFSSQTFVPMDLSSSDQTTRYVVVVAPTIANGEAQMPLEFSYSAQMQGIGLPDLSNLRAFVAQGDQAVTYAAGTWHAPMIVLGGNSINFVVWQYANGVAGEDCEEIHLNPQRPGKEGIVVEVPPHLDSLWRYQKLQEAKLKTIPNAASAEMRKQGRVRYEKVQHQDGDDGERPGRNPVGTKSERGISFVLFDGLACEEKEHPDTVYKGAMLRLESFQQRNKRNKTGDRLNDSGMDERESVQSVPRTITVDISLLLSFAINKFAAELVHKEYFNTAKDATSVLEESIALFLALARRDTNVLRAARFIAALLILAGVGWLFLLPLDEYNRHTYISENALLPGQVHTYFGGSEHEVFRAYRHEVNGLAAHDASRAAAEIERIFLSQGFKTARQPYNFTYGDTSIAGDNAYALLEGPRADATEAMVLMASLHNMNNEINYSGVALVLTMARYFKRWSLWSKDILFVITSDSKAGPQAWVSAYHELHDLASTAPLTLKAGAIQAAVALDYAASPAGHRFDKLHVHYDGVNGALPNLDLLNTISTVASNQVGITSSIQGMHSHTDSYFDRLATIFCGILSQGTGAVTGPHSAFMSYHIDAVTLQTVGDGWHDEMSLGMVVESSFRSINNLLEKLHQSFFFYLLLGSDRFVSIGTYLPSAMLVAASFTIMGLALWNRSGKPADGEMPAPSDPVLRQINRERAESVAKGEKPQDEPLTLQYKGNVTVMPVEMLQAEERAVAAPIALVVLAHLIGLVPFFLLNNYATLPSLVPIAHPITRQLASMALFSSAAMIAMTFMIHTTCRTSQQRTLVACFSLVLLGVALATLSTINFSLGLLVGLGASPLAFILPGATSKPDTTSSSFTNLRKNPLTTLGLAILLLTCPESLFGLLDNTLYRMGRSLPESILQQVALAWHVNGTWTSMAIYLLWWPAWLLRISLLGASLL
ncbi:MAG: hypothetical protein Q9159_001720 [Coniocarpon cinnabarinum]